jgi:hypothetical protein
VTDRIEICSLGCAQCEQIVNKGVIHVLSIGTAGAPNTLTGNTAFPPVLLKQGVYYDICYKTYVSGTTITLPMGQIYITSPVTHVYPFNRGIK